VEEVQRWYEENVSGQLSMKAVIILFLAGISFSLQAQHTANLDFYAGTWTYVNTQTGEEFVLKLRKTIEHRGSRECLVGAYTYKKNGKIVTDCMEQFSKTQSVYTMPILASNSSKNPSDVNPNWLWMFVDDYGKFCPNGAVKSTTSNSLEIVSSVSPQKIRWILKNDVGDEYLEDEAPPMEFSIPVDMILTKQPENLLKEVDTKPADTKPTDTKPIDSKQPIDDKKNLLKPIEIP